MISLAVSIHLIYIDVNYIDDNALMATLYSISTFKKDIRHE